MRLQKFIGTIVLRTVAYGATVVRLIVALLFEATLSQSRCFISPPVSYLISAMDNMHTWAFVKSTN